MLGEELGKVGINFFLLYHFYVLTIVPKSWTSLCELIHFISRLHPLHFTSSSTSLSWHIRLRWLKETTELAEWDECSDRRRRMRLLKESNAVTEGDECDSWRSRMQWPEETNAVAGGDTFWTLITRVCCIIINWVHLKTSRIIFFVFVTYWQSMARFRKNDFFKWAQKIKSVFCFIPHTHEGCDLLDDNGNFIFTGFQSTPTKGVTKPGVWRESVLKVSIHTPTKGVTLFNTFIQVSI